MAEVADRVTGPLADDVDARSRFPTESIDGIAGGPPARRVGAA